MRALLALLAITALGLQGCGSAPAAPPGSATLSDSSTTPSAAAATASHWATGFPTTPSLSPARALAAQLTQAESVTASPQSSDDDVRRAAEFEQLAVRMLSESPARARRRVTGRLTGRAAAVIAADLSAAGGLRSITPAQPALPKWRIIAPLSAHELLGLYRDAQRTTGVPWNYLAAINFVETKFGRIVGPSYAGAQGPMQFMPGTWSEYGAGGDVHDPHDAIPAAARLLRANGAPRDMARALRAYNNSASYVNAVTSYARVIRRWPGALRGYIDWRVLYRARSGVYVLPEGYPTTRPTRIE